MPKTKARKSSEELLQELMEGASGFDAAAFIGASLRFLGDHEKMDPMEALAKVMWGEFFREGASPTTKTRILEAFIRCLQRLPAGPPVGAALPNLTDEQLAQAQKDLIAQITEKLAQDEARDAET
jgi:hypothetical protein